MSSQVLSIEAALADCVLVQNPRYQDDYEKVVSFVALKGRQSRPIDSKIFPRASEDFDAVLGKLPSGFFESFDRLLTVVGMSPIKISNHLETIEVWNNEDFLPLLVSATGRHLDQGDKTALIPALLSVFMRLDQERPPSPEQWPEIGAISIPGSRTYDRPAEAFRAYLKTRGNSVLITSGKSPYYDENNNNLELSEAEANAALLRLLGVPNERIYTEADSEDTEENADYLAGVIRQVEKDQDKPITKILLVTSPYHLTRYRLNVDLMLKDRDINAEVFAIGSRASRYWAETYFIDDDKSGYTRDATLGVVFNEYLKIAFDVCAKTRPDSVKAEAPRA